ncbi:MAG: hypothetical protein WA958_06280 [Tunicatimonas sp.]
MNLLLHALAVSSFVVIPCLTAAAQQDSVSVTYAEEPADSSSFSLKEKYRYWTRANVEDKFMLKNGISGLGFGGIHGFFLEHTTSVEMKIGVPFSVMAQLRSSITRWGREDYIGVDVAVRYYYSLPRRIRQGKSANNLSANYFSIQMDHTWPDGSGFIVQALQPAAVETEVNQIRQFSLLYGIQRRLGRPFYVDFNVGATYQPEGRVVNHRNRLFLDFNFAVGFVMF